VGDVHCINTSQNQQYFPQDIWYAILGVGKFLVIPAGVMNTTLSDEQRAKFYKSHRERSATNFKKKHRLQFDRDFAELTGATPSMAVLEIGCGTGLFLRYLEAYEYEEIVGIDGDENLASALRDLKLSEVYLDDALSVLKNKLDTRKFDRIVMFDVAEHLQLDVLVNLMNLLGDHINIDGKLLLRVPNIESPWGLKMFYGSFDHVTPLSPGRIYELGVMTNWLCEGVFPQKPNSIMRRLKEGLINKILGALLSYHPDIWTANLLAVYNKK
jgi:SAM-dependent methyltransferase